MQFVEWIHFYQHHIVPSALQSSRIKLKGSIQTLQDSRFLTTEWQNCLYIKYLLATKCAFSPVARSVTTTCMRNQDGLLPLLSCQMRIFFKQPIVSLRQSVKLLMLPREKKNRSSWGSVRGTLPVLPLLPHMAMPTFAVVPLPRHIPVWIERWYLTSPSLSLRWTSAIT